MGFLGNFRFNILFFDSFVIQLDMHHPRWKEAAKNVLTVMGRPCIINGHTVRVRTEAKFGRAWGDGMVDWKSSDPHDIDRIAMSM